MYLTKINLAILASFCSIILSYGQEKLMVRGFDASCETVCDGSAEILNFRISPERYYYWRSIEERGFRTLEESYLSNLCAGTYQMRQVDISYEEIELPAIPILIDGEFELISQFSFSSANKRELTLYLDLDRDVPFLNYHTKAEYSLDNGETWKNSSQLNRKITTDISGNGTSQYLLNLPKSASNREVVLIRVYGRTIDPEKELAIKQVQITSCFLESKLTSDIEIDIKAKEVIKIKTIVSNEIDGADGYISLDIKGGMPPYSILWDDGVTAQKRTNLSAGAYSVKVMDRKHCSQEAVFSILPPVGLNSKQDFSFTPTLSEGLFQLEIVGLYRQPLDLVITHIESIEVKRYRINPLYDDLSMELDLSFLPKGDYTATLSTSGFSKKAEIVIN